MSLLNILRNQSVVIGVLIDPAIVLSIFILSYSYKFLWAFFICFVSVCIIVGDPIIQREGVEIQLTSLTNR